jgi:Tat protein translocase TatC
MSADSSSPPPAGDAAVAEIRREVVDGGMMSFGDHLEELRSCSIRALVGLLVTTVLSLIFAKRILAVVLKPAVVVLNAHGQRSELQALSPPDTFIMYLKMALVSGLILAMPWVLMQVWRFVSVGLYAREQRFLRLFTPISLGLFVAGVAFMFLVVLPVVLNFFVTFSQGIQVDDLELSFLQSWIVRSPEEGEPPRADELDLPALPIVDQPPAGAEVGAMWFDASRDRLCIQGEETIFVTPLQPARNVAAVRNQFSLGQYVGFVMMLSLGFGLAFELPLIVLFVTSMGIFTADELARSRRHVIFGIVALAAVLTPPDVISQVLLAVPMILLFETALFVSRRLVKPHPGD